MLLSCAVVSQPTASKDTLKQHVYTLAADSMKGRGVNSTDIKKTADYIVSQMEQAGIKPYGGHYRYPFTFKQGEIRAFGNNIVGVIDGSDPTLKNEFIVIGAHYDHVGYELRNGKEIVYNGADDNASGVAAILEIGRLLALQKDALKRSVIIVAFDAEESGHWGSDLMVKDSTIPLQKVKVMFSVDMVGMFAANMGLDLIGSATLESGNAFFSEVASKHGVKLKNLGENIDMATDTYSFGLIGIPSIAATTGTLSPYHTPKDDANLLDYDGMVTVANILTESVLKLSSKESLQPAAFFGPNKMGKWTRLFTAGAKLGVGVSHHRYPDESFKGKNLLAANVGFYGRFRMNKRVFLQPEIQYETMGFKTLNGDMRTHAISIPCHVFLALLGKEAKDIDVLLGLGGYGSYTFTGKVDGKAVDFTNDYRRNDYGISYGLSAEYFGYQYGVFAKHGLANIHRQPFDSRNTAVYFTFGFRF